MSKGIDNWGHVSATFSHNFTIMFKIGIAKEYIFVSLNVKSPKINISVP